MTAAHISSRCVHARAAASTAQQACACGGSGTSSIKRQGVPYQLGACARVAGASSAPGQKDMPGVGCDAADASQEHGSGRDPNDLHHGSDWLGSAQSLLLSRLVEHIGMLACRQVLLLQQTSQEMMASMVSALQQAKQGSKEGAVEGDRQMHAQRWAQQPRCPGP